MSSNNELIRSLIREGVLKTPELIDAFRAIDRNDFVPESFEPHAYADQPLPIGEGQTISQPYTVAFMLELLAPKPGDRVLDIGSGSGWTGALLAFVVTQKNERGSQGHVWTQERIASLCAKGEKNIEKYGFITQKKVSPLCMDGTNGFPAHAPFDKILAGATAQKKIPDAWRAQCAVGGRIVAPIDNEILLALKKTSAEWEEHRYPGFVFVPLVSEKSRSGALKPFFIRLMMGFMLLATGSFLLVQEISVPHTRHTRPHQVTIPQGYGSRKIGGLLKEEGIVRSKWVFVTYVSLRGQASSLKPGTYTFFSTSTIPDIMRALLKGSGNEYVITIPEGWNIQDIDAYLAREGIFPPQQFAQFAHAQFRPVLATSSLLADLPSGKNLEGFLFPDTYRIFLEASTSALTIRMLENFQRKLTPELRAEIVRQKKDVYTFVIMASLLEREVRSDRDRALVSGILWKRIQKNIPLQVDATIYYIKKMDARVSGNNSRITLQDTKIPSLYNTYLHKGLPPAPICNPGLSALMAALFPEESPYFYYLSAPDGTTIFSHTLEEHNRAKVRYLSGAIPSS
ncbi:MAG: UPF0755 protein [Parcubacteria group bacterium Gr01-1014_66]|nr:MAG: UPF0755 protein [Parcubacteria group bacterium Gr01-1014_66]